MIQSLLSVVLRLGGRSVYISSKGMAPLHEVNIPTSKATFAMGCFWGPDSLFGATKGVIRTRVGFTGGSKGIPTYKNIGDHTEAIEIDFDPNEIKYSELLDMFWSHHDPTARTTKQYTSIIFYHDDEQKSLAERTLKEQQAKVKGSIITTIVPAQTFYNAEDYHQKYRLQQYPELMAAIGLTRNTQQLIASHVAARLNGYVVGQGGVKQFEEEASKLGLNEEATEHVRKLVTKFQGHGLLC